MVAGEDTTSTYPAGGRALIPKNAFGWPTLCGFLHLRPIPLHSRDERWGRSPLPFSNFHFLFSKLREFRRGAAAFGFKAAGFDLFRAKPFSKRREGLYQPFGSIFSQPSWMACDMASRSAVSIEPTKRTRSRPGVPAGAVRRRAKSRTFCCRGASMRATSSRISSLTVFVTVRPI
jgi:hypothetical protein